MKIELEAEDRYEVLVAIVGSLGESKQFIGDKGRCRFCEESKSATFRNQSHTFPEALGNKWVFSRDECDACNNLFSRYEDELTKCVQPFLTLGGVKGKRKVPQTGRSSGNAVVRHQRDFGRRRLSFFVNDADPRKFVSMNRATGILNLEMPVADVPFRPRYAFQALSKMGFALLPETEIANHTRLRAWLQDTDESIDSQRLDVLMSFASIGNAPNYVTGTLLRRSNDDDSIPRILFLFTAGSVCFQIDLISDEVEDRPPSLPPCPVKIRWSTVISGKRREAPAKFKYSEPICLDWTSADLEPQPVEKFRIGFNPITRAGKITPIFRASI